jgi:CBS domain-containing protein
MRITGLGGFMQVKDVMTKGIACVDTRSSAADAAKKMKDQNVGTIMVIDSDQLKGIVTDRAIVTKAVAEQQDPRQVPVSKIMTTDIIGCRESDDVMDAVKTMGDNKIRRMPVVNDRDQLVGVVSMADIAQEMRPCINSIFDDITKATK